VRAYLAEFLADPRVIPLPRWLWLPILHLVVLRTRPRKSAEKYAQIWTPEGSPLRVHTARQAELLGDKTGLQVEYAMRYGEPAIRATLAKMPPDTLVVPLYPQYSDSATGTVLALAPDRKAIHDFHDHPAYIAALAALVSRHRKCAKLVMSFHGLPKRGGEEYERQSRFGAAEWLQPYTQPTLEELARAGNPQVDVVCPGFVSDCLETLEELGITARDAFLAAGGKELNLMPCLNEAPEWIEALEKIAARGRSSSE
jgi:ferrochelatase